MSFNLPLKAMSLHEKLTAIEALWEDLSRTPEDIESPASHKDVLDDRRQRLTDGQSQFVDWETAKAEIRNKVL